MPKARQKPRPVHKAKLGSFQLAVWANEHETDGASHTFHTITLERNYKDKSDEWQMLHKAEKIFYEFLLRRRFHTGSPKK